MYFRGTAGPPDLELIRAVQRTLAVPRVVTAARAFSLFGEHAAGWLVLGAVAALADRPRRRQWLEATARVAAAHALSIGIKRLVRRPRPAGEFITVHTPTLGELSFPSSHAASTTAAAVAFGRVAGLGPAPLLVPLLVPPMALSRVVLGVHYPTDVLAGSALGAFVAVAGEGRR